MVTNDYIARLRKLMEREHQRDREALDRLENLVSGGGSVVRVASLQARLRGKQQTGDADKLNSSSMERPLIEEVESIFLDHRNKTWKPRTIIRELRNRGVPLRSKTPQTSISMVLKKLLDRDRIRLVMRGSGRMPSVYEYKPVQPAEADTEEDGT